MTTSVSPIDQANLLFHANSAFLQPFSPPSQDSIREAPRNWKKKFYWSLENENGDEFIKTMRCFNAALYNLDFDTPHMRTWTDWSFNNRPVIYEVIIKCKLVILQSLLKCPEGGKLLNQSYPPIGLDYNGQNELLIEPRSEFPIHTAIRLCYSITLFKDEMHADKFPPCYPKAFSILQELVAHQAQLNQENCVGRTPLYLAAKTNQPDMMDFLLAHGALSIKMNCNTASLNEKELLFLFERYKVLRQKIAEILATTTPLLRDLISLSTEYV